MPKMFMIHLHKLGERREILILNSTTRPRNNDFNFTIKIDHWYKLIINNLKFLSFPQKHVWGTHETLQVERPIKKGKTE